MYQLFFWHLYLTVLRGATSLLGALEGVGHENLDFFDVTIAPSPPPMSKHPSMDAYLRGWIE
jgi:hypothetical protein